MNLARRRILAGSALAAGLLSINEAAAAGGAGSGSPLLLDASQVGLKPGSSEDQTRILQRAIDQAAGLRVPLHLPPGSYRTAELRLPSGAQIIGVRGSTRLIFLGGSALLSAQGAAALGLEGLTLDGGGKAMPEGRGLVTLGQCRGVRIRDCEITGAGRVGIALDGVEGEIAGNAISAPGEAGILSQNARGLAITRNLVRGAGNNGILVWRSEPGDDGTIVSDNRVEEIAARNGGSGQNGNGINVFRAGNVIVQGNQIRGCAFSAIRGNGASNIQILGNNCTGLGEVAIYAEFGFEGAIIANNSIEGAALGIAVTNFKEGGRLAVVQGNVIRSLLPKRPAGTDPNDGAGIGIGVEADTAVTGNVIEGAPTAGITVGYAQYLRDVTVTGNVIRNSGVGVAVSVAPGAGHAVIADNLISGSARGAIVGMERRREVTGDLAKAGAERFAQLAIAGNRVR